MALKKSEKRLLIIAGLVVVAFLFDKLVLGKKTTQRPVAKRNPVTVAAKQGSVNQNLIQNTTYNRIAYSDWGKDPFRVKEEKKVVAASFTIQPKKPAIPEATLHGIFWKQGKGFVLINEDVMSEGETKNGIRVDRIENQRVLCNYAGQSFTLYWRETL